MVQHTPVLGEPAPRVATRTARKLSGFALRHAGPYDGTPRQAWCLDVGCGNGSITTQLAGAFANVVGIDVEPNRLQEFRNLVRGGQRFHVLTMSGSELAFDNHMFSLVTAFEVLEHVPDLNATVGEIVRVCKPDGLVVISVPQVWFPFENHGMIVGGRLIRQKIPLLPYLRPLHRRYGAARVFSSGQLDRLFEAHGMCAVETAYASPQFERAAMSRTSWERHFVGLRSLLERSETKPVLRQLTGVSILKAYRRAGSGAR